VSTVAVVRGKPWTFKNTGMAFSSILGCYVLIILFILPFYMFMLTEIYYRN